jgi:hypothetical protein
MTTTPIQQPVPGGAGKKPNTLIITLSIVGGVLLLAVIALAFLLIGRGTASGDGGQALATSAAPTPTPTVTEAAPPPPPEDTSPRFTSFDAVTEVQCPQDGEKPEIQFSWETAHAVEVWYTSGHEDAVVDNYMQVPLSGSQADLTDEHLFPCNHRGTQDYTVTLVGDNGEHVSEFWTVTDLNWQG